MHNIKNNNSHIIFTNIDWSEKEKNKNNDKKIAEQLQPAILSKEKEDEEKTKKSQLNREKMFQGIENGSIPGVFVFHGTVFPATNKGIQRMKDVLQEKLKSETAPQCNLIIRHDGFGAQDKNMDMMIMECAEEQVRSDNTLSRVQSEKNHIKQLLSPLKKNNKLNNEYQSKEMQEVEDGIFEYMYPQFWNIEQIEKDKHCIFFIPNVTLPSNEREAYVLDDMMDMLLKPFCTMTKPSNGLPSLADVGKIAERSAKACSEIFSSISNNDNLRINIAQMPNSYGNYTCTAILQQFLKNSQESLKNKIFLHNNNTLNLANIPTSTYKDLNYKMLAQQVAGLFVEYSKMTDNKQFNLNIKVESYDVKALNKFGLHNFNMTKKFLLALNDCLKNTGIEVKTHFQRRCDCEEYNSECKECQRYNECVNEMMRDGFIKQTDNNKENNSSPKMNNISQTEINNNTATFALNGAYEQEKINESYLGFSNCWCRSV